MTRRIPDDCTVRLIDLPYGIGGRISEAPDGHVDIYAAYTTDAATEAARRLSAYWQDATK